MKRLIIFYALLFVAACSTSTDWDSGGQRQGAFEEQRMEERTEDVRNQNPEVVNPVRYQPF